jgi:hypothetical protein
LQHSSATSVYEPEATLNRAAREAHHCGVTGSARSPAVGAIARHLKLRLGVPFEPNRPAKTAARDAHGLIHRSIE